MYNFRNNKTRSFLRTNFLEPELPIGNELPGNNPLTEKRDTNLTPSISNNPTLTTNQPTGIDTTGSMTIVPSLQTQTIVPGLSTQTITPSPSLSTQTITPGGINKSPTDGLPYSRTNFLKKATSTFLKHLFNKRTKSELPEYALPSVGGYVTLPLEQIEHRMREDIRRTYDNTTDHQLATLAKLSIHDKVSKSLSELYQKTQENILGQKEQRRKEMDKLREFEVDVKNKEKEARNKEAALKALIEKQRYEEAAGLIVEGLFGNEEDNKANKEAIEKYLDAKTQIEMQQLVSKKTEEMGNKLKEVDKKYEEELKRIEEQYNKETDEGKKSELKEKYNALKTKHQQERTKVNDEYKKFIQEDIYKILLEMSKKNYETANEFVLPTNVGIYTKSLRRGGLTLPELITLKTEQSKLRREEAKLKSELRKEELSLIYKMKKELKESLLKKESKKNEEKLKMKLMNYLINDLI